MNRLEDLEAQEELGGQAWTLTGFGMPGTTAGLMLDVAGFLVRNVAHIRMKIGEVTDTLITTHPYMGILAAQAPQGLIGCNECIIKI